MGGGVLNIAGTVRFVSDLHLRSDRPDLSERFSRFLTECGAQHIAALFILGDLFEYWIGDDNLGDPFTADIVVKLRQLSDSGTQLFFVHGNRDFLIRSSFAAATGANLLPEQSVLDIAKTPVGAGTTPSSETLRALLLHGDTLCTDDHAYQNFRRLARTDEWQENFLAKSLDTRRAEVAELRRQSTEAVRQKSAEIMDANALAVRHTLAASGCHIMIHGHTHRPGHEIVDANTGSERWVLSDWDVGRGDALEIKAANIQRLDWSH